MRFCRWRACYREAKTPIISPSKCGCPGFPLAGVLAFLPSKCGCPGFPRRGPDAAGDGTRHPRNVGVLAFPWLVSLPAKCGCPGFPSKCGCPGFPGRLNVPSLPCRTTCGGNKGNMRPEDLQINSKKPELFQVPFPHERVGSSP